MCVRCRRSNAIPPPLTACRRRRRIKGSGRLEDDNNDSDSDSCGNKHGNLPVFYYRLTNEQLCNDTDGRQNYCFELKVEMKVVMIVESERYRRAFPAFSVFGAPSFRFWREPSSTRQAVARLAAQFFHVDVYRREAKADVSRGNNGTNNPLLSRSRYQKVDHGEQRICSGCWMLIDDDDR